MPNGSKKNKYEYTKCILGKYARVLVHSIFNTNSSKQLLSRITGVVYNRPGAKPTT